MRAANVVSVGCGIGCLALVCCAGERPSAVRASSPEVAVASASAPSVLPPLPSEVPGRAPPPLPPAPVASTSGPAPLPFSGTDPFEAPPSGPPAPLQPVRPRMAPIVQSPAEQARRAASCAAASGCDACAELHGCEFCQDNGRCVPADIHGPYPGTCRAGDLWDAASCPRAPKRRASEARVRAFLQSGMRGLNPEGAPVDVPARDLTRRVRFPVHRGRCYGLVFRTSLDLENPWQLNASASAPAPRLLGGGDWDSRMDEAVLTRFCPHESGEIVVGANPVTVQRGTWRAQLFSGPGSEEALRAAEAELEERKRVRSFQYYCAHCARGHLGCQLSGEPECEAKYTVCLAAVGLSREACERGPFAPPPGRPAPPPPQALLGEP